MTHPHFLYKTCAVVLIIFASVHQVYFLLNGELSIQTKPFSKVDLSTLSRSSIHQPCHSYPILVGPVKVRVNVPSLFEIEKLYASNFSLGGHYKPPTCRSISRVAIIVPLRDREEHLRILLYNLIPILQRQQLEFKIFVVEQITNSKNEAFNRAMLFNVGFVEASKTFSWDCYIFHDVDLIPENDSNMYDCPNQPRHLSVAVDKMGYVLPYDTIFGGISALTKEQFITVNGFSNMFWGWGGEDDDMAGRIPYHGFQITRPSASVARYKMLNHRPQLANPERFRILQESKQRYEFDGLSNLRYTLEKIFPEKIYTLIRVQLQKVGWRKSALSFNED